jgi:hypothetical protein
VAAQTGRVSAAGQAGGALLVAAAEATGLAGALERELGPWVKPLARHRPGKIICDLVIAIALGADCLADVKLVRSEPDLYGPVASDPVVSRLVKELGRTPVKAGRAIERAGAAARAWAWKLAQDRSPAAGASAADPLVVDLDATVLIAHSEKEKAAPTWKRTFGFHPLCAFVDHGASGTGEALHLRLRPGNAGSNTAKDHIEVTRRALAQLPLGPSKKVLIRTDSGGGTHQFIDWLTAKGLAYSIGWTLPANTPDLIDLISRAGAWTPAIEPDGTPREGAEVAELTGLLDLDSWPQGLRVICRRERPHPGAQLRFEDVDGYRITAFCTNQTTANLARLELRHRRRARCEDRIRCAKDTGLRNLPLHRFGQNQIWCHLVTLATNLIAWTQTLALDGKHRLAEPKRLRIMLFACPAVLIRTGRQTICRFSDRAPWAKPAANGLTRLRQHARAPS